MCRRPTNHSPSPCLQCLDPSIVAQACIVPCLTTKQSCAVGYPTTEHIDDPANSHVCPAVATRITLDSCPASCHHHAERLVMHLCFLIAKHALNGDCGCAYAPVYVLMMLATLDSVCAYCPFCVAPYSDFRSSMPCCLRQLCGVLTALLSTAMKSNGGIYSAHTYCTSLCTRYCYDISVCKLEH
jgi:hypothetical protein